MRTATTLATLIVTMLWVPLVSAQPSPAASETTAATSTQPTTIDQPFQATIIQITGKARYALVDQEGVPGQWQKAKVGDRLPASTQVRTFLRSRVVLAFGNDTVVAIDSATKMSIDEFHRTGKTKRVNLGLAHGLVRAGVRETTLRSDMTIKTPTATLSKEGTMDFGMQYDAGNGQSYGFLNVRGLVNFTNTLTGQSRYLGPGQNVAQAMVKWIDALQAKYPTVIDNFGTTSNERNFVINNGGGLGSIDPGAGANTFTITVNTPATTGGQSLPTRPNIPEIPTLPLLRPEGNFGTGSIILPLSNTN